MRFVALLLFASALPAAPLDLRRATVVARSGDIAATVLVEEVERRTGIRLLVSASPPAKGVAIAITVESGRPESYRLTADDRGIRIAGDPRGALYGVGHLLRQLRWSKGALELDTPLDISTAPAYPIRGHQLGYRAAANSWDAWTVAQFDQYIRELALFGANSIENIPFQDDRQSPLMKVPRREMNRAMSEICARYGLDYWVWTPADFDLNNASRRAEHLASFDALFKDLPTLTGVFVPGGDPGSNEPDILLPYLAAIAEHMRPFHPRAKVWLSMQGFSKEQAETVYRFLDRGVPAWFGGIVVGPSSPPLAETRRRVPRGVKLRLYPDVTHNKLSQYEVPEWDQAYALTLGREAINPRPTEYAAIFRREAPMSDGFLSYSDGVHDDVNKTVWSALAWDPARDVRDILVEYARLHFGSAVAEEAADGLLALERNWRGPLAANGGVEATLRLWETMKGPSLDNWRWDMCLLRAFYDAHVRRRLIQDTQLEAEANAVMAQAAKLGPDEAMTRASEILNRWSANQTGFGLRARIIGLCDRLFHSIGLQTSVAKYQASGEERGAVLDFIDNPLNNRWWLEDEFAKIRALPDRSAKVARLEALAKWENPGPGSFYDNVGNQSKAPRVIRAEGEDASSLFWWWDNGKSRARLSWQVTLWPKDIVYEGLDPKARYRVRTTGYGQGLLRVDGERVRPEIDGREMHEFKEFPVPAKALEDGKLVLTWDIPTDEGQLNWRRRSRLAEVWLLKQ